jgi:hypothetical protein
LMNPETPVTTKTLCLQHTHNERVIHFVKSFLKIELESNHLLLRFVTMMQVPISLVKSVSTFF